MKTSLYKTGRLSRINAPICECMPLRCVFHPLELRDATDAKKNSFTAVVAGINRRACGFGSACVYMYVCMCGFFVYVRYITGRPILCMYACMCVCIQTDELTHLLCKHLQNTYNSSQDADERARRCLCVSTT
jgi:hypothetical protein